MKLYDFLKIMLKENCIAVNVLICNLSKINSVEDLFTETELAGQFVADKLLTDEFCEMEMIAWEVSKEKNQINVLLAKNKSE